MILLLNISEKLAENLQAFIPKTKLENNELLNFIKETINTDKRRQRISCRKISMLYEEKYKKNRKINFTEF